MHIANTVHFIHEQNMYHFIAEKKSVSALRRDEKNGEKKDREQEWEWESRQIQVRKWTDCEIKITNVEKKQ